MQLDKAFEFAVVLAWSDLLKIVVPVAVRIEYRRESKKLLDHVTIWAAKGKGYHDRVCDYSTVQSQSQPIGVRFWKGHQSEQLSERLSFIMLNQDRFTFSRGARNGLILVSPPGDKARAEAVAWLEESTLNIVPPGHDGIEMSHRPPKAA